MYFSTGDFFWDGVGTLLQNNYKPSVEDETKKAHQLARSIRPSWIAADNARYPLSVSYRRTDITNYRVASLIKIN